MAHFRPVSKFKDYPPKAFADICNNQIEFILLIPSFYPNLPVSLELMQNTLSTFEAEIASVEDKYNTLLLNTDALLNYIANISGKPPVVPSNLKSPYSKHTTSGATKKNPSEVKASIAWAESLIAVIRSSSEMSQPPINLDDATTIVNELTTAENDMLATFDVAAANFNTTTEYLNNKQPA